MKITFAEQNLILHPMGVLLWPAHRLAILGDLHLEKGSHFARRGYLLPPYDTHVTLNKLLAVCTAENIRQLLILGDCFHDERGYARLSAADRALFLQLLSYDPLWIRGNHDGEFVPPGFAAHDAYERDNIVFRHEAMHGASGEISGHFHPKAMFFHKGGYVTRACFIEDGNKLILPAFGAYTGGLDVRENVILDHFTSDTRLHLLGQNKVFTLPLAHYLDQDKKHGT